MANKLKPWWQVINFYKLIGLVLIWISAWLFMMPIKVDITAPYFENFWGELFAVFGVYKQELVNAQQKPDLLSALAALVLMIILQVRGIFKFTQNDETEEIKIRPVTVFLNLLSVLIHTIFFTMLIKVFVFPSTGENHAILDKLKADIGMTIFATVCITGTILGAQSLARLILILFSAVCIFKNITFINNALGLWGFAAILCAVAGFYLEFCGGGISKKNLLLDLNFLAGKYEAMTLKAKEETTKLATKGKSFLSHAERIAKEIAGTQGTQNSLEAISESKQNETLPEEADNDQK